MNRLTKWKFRLQHCRIWSEANPRQYLDTLLHSLKLTVWCEIHAKGINGQYLIRNVREAAITVNGVRYRHMLNTFLFSKMQELYIDISWFQEDSATCHIVIEIINLLKWQMIENVIWRNGSVIYPLRSCDFIPPDYFLRGYVKSMVVKPTTLDALKYWKKWSEIGPIKCAS